MAVEEGVVDLDTPAGPEGSTVRHLLSHASGLSMQSPDVQARPGARRIYSNYGFQVLAEAIEAESGIEFARYLDEAVFSRWEWTLPMWRAAPRRPVSAQSPASTTRSRSPGICCGRSRCRRRCTPRPPACSSPTSTEWCLASGCSDPMTGDWALRSATGSPRTGRAARTPPGPTGTSGQTGTLLWVDPARDIALVVLTDRDFGDWAKPLWPALSDLVLAEFVGLAQQGSQGHNRHARHNCIFGNTRSLGKTSLVEPKEQVMRASNQFADATTGVVYLHASPAAVCPHVEWALSSTLGAGRT